MTRLLITNRSIIAIIALISFGFLSCESDVHFEVPDGDSKLFAFSEINPSESIYVKVNTSIGINTSDKFYFPKQTEAIVTLYKNGEELLNPGFRYISSKKAFVSQGAYRPEVGAKYGLHVELTTENHQIKDIYAETIIPAKDTLSNILIEPSNTHRVEVHCDFKNTINDYFMLVPKIVSDKGDVENIQLRNIDNNDDFNAVSVFDHKLLIAKGENSQTLSFLLESDNEVKNKGLHLELRSITQDAYEYYIKQTLQLESQNISIAEPIIGHTNFQNGLGLFAGYSSTRYELLIL